MTGPSARMLALLSLLQTRRDWPGHVLSDRLGVTTRTVRRDVDRLRELGYRIDAAKGPDGGYRLEAGSELPPLLFDDDQAVAISIALQIAAASGVEIEEPAERALATIRQVMPSRLRHRIDQMAFAVRPSSTHVDAPVLEAVSLAALRREVLRFDYADDTRPRRAEPHGVVARHGRWYLVAWDLDRADWRIFRLDRLQPRTPTGPRFVPRDVPAGDPASFLAARAKGADALDAWPCIGTFDVEMPVRDVTPWVKDGQVEVISVTSTRVTTGSWSWDGLLASAVRFGAPLSVVGPPAFTQAAQVASERLRDAIR